LLVPNRPQPPQGVHELIAQTSEIAAQHPLSSWGTLRFLLVFAERFAFIRLQDLWHPVRFLSQMEGAPPIKLGMDGFKHSLLDDTNPARHYAAFVFVGYWLPNFLGLLVLWLWELAGAVRYGYWSQPDVRSGYTGFYHGRLIRRYGHTILPSLMARDLTEPSPWGRLSYSARRSKQKMNEE
jgi:hypothetical protein